MLLHKESQDSLTKMHRWSLKLMTYNDFKVTLGKNRRKQRKKKENCPSIASQGEQ